MTNTKNTKRALLSSVMALFLCFAMLLGTTYAWFTDSVTSAGNIIQSGTLDVTMEWLKGTDAPTDDAAWTDASEGAIFNSTLWEPGYVEARHIKIANEGTLALKYQLQIVANGEVSKLSDVIDVYYIDPAVQINDRTQFADEYKLGTLTEVLDNLGSAESTAVGNLLAGEKHTITLALKMQEDAGNEYQGLSIGSDFSIMLFATQYTAESDSIDENYDKGATLPWNGSIGTVPEVVDNTVTIFTPAELAAFAVAVNDGNSYSGKTILLANDINLGNQAWTPIGACDSAAYFQGTFDGQGHTIYGLNVDNSTDGYQFSTSGLFGWVDAASATIQNVKINGAIVKGSHWVGVIAGYMTGEISNCSVTNSTVIGYNVNDNANGDKVGGIVGYMNSGAGSLAGNTVSDSTIIGYRDVAGIAGAVATDNSVKNNSVMNTTVMYEADYAATIVSAKTAVVVDETNVATNVTVKKVVTTAAGLKTALAAGETNINIAANITLTESLSANNVTLVGVNEDAGINFAGYNITGDGTSTITYKDLTLTTISLPYGGAGVGERYGWYGGIDYVRHAIANYENCTISGIFTLYSNTVNVTGCTFLNYVQDGKTFNQIFQYGTQTANITDCTFNYSNRAIKVYNEGGTKDLVMNVTGCTFKADESFDANYDDNKSLISIDPTFVTSVKLTVKDITIDDALNGIDLHNAEGNAKITVVTE